MTVTEEKSSLTLADRLDEVVTTASFAFIIINDIDHNLVNIYNIVHFKYRNPIILC